MYSGNPVIWNLPGHDRREHRVAHPVNDFFIGGIDRGENAGQLRPRRIAGAVDEVIGAKPDAACIFSTLPVAKSNQSISTRRGLW
jgi:hypothetical protein